MNSPDKVESSFTIACAGNKTFTVCIKDILTASVDSIVNPANSHLAHGGGLAAIIARASGSELIDDCHEIIKDRGQIPVGSAVISKAGNLPFKGVIHAVGPIMGSGNEFEKIACAIHSVMILVEQQQWQSVAFPAISTGIFSVPVSICAKAFAKAVPEYFNNHPDTTIQTVMLCLMPQDFSEFRMILGNRL